MFRRKQTTETQPGTTLIENVTKAEVMAHAEVGPRDEALVYRDAARVLNNAILNGVTSIETVRDDYEKETAVDPERQKKVVQHLSMYIGHDIEKVADNDIEVADANLNAASRVAAQAGAHYDDAEARAERARERSERIGQII